MTLLAFLISIAYIPGWTGISIPTGWAVMSVTLPWVSWCRTRLNVLHWLGAAFLIYAIVSLSWAPNVDDGIGELWHLMILAFAFLLGSQVNTALIWRGLAIGCGVSSAIAILQWYGGPDWQILPTSDWGKPAGLFFNNAVAGAVAAIVVVANRDSPWYLAGVPLLLLSQSRGAWLAVLATVFLCSRWRMRAFLVVVLLAAFWFWWPYLHSATDSLRWQIWQNITIRLTWLGHGAGSLMSVFAVGPTQLFHIEHAHNDYLSLAYTYGLGAIPLLAMVAVLAIQRSHHDWPVLICCLTLASYFWVLSSPIPAFALAVAAGRMCADCGWAWSDVRDRGLGLLQWPSPRPALASSSRRRYLPLQLGSKE